MPANNRKNPFLLAPALAFAVLVLLLVFGFLTGDGGVGTLLLTSVLTLIAFGVPLVFFCFLRGASFSVLFPMRKPGKKELLLVLSALLSLIFLTAAVKYALFHTEFDYREISLYGFSFSRPESFGEGLLCLLAVAILPAVAEELVFRGALTYEYRHAGVFMGAVLASVLSAMMGLSFSSFLPLLLSALCFALVRFLTGNLAASMLVHIGYGVYTLFFEKYMWLMSFSSEAKAVYTLLTVGCFGVSFFFFMHLSERTLRERAEKGEEAPVRVTGNKRILMLFEIFTAPPLWMLLCIYLVWSVIRLFI